MTTPELGLLDHLFLLWTRLVNEPDLPSLDRWLARELKALEKLRRSRRLWLGEQLTDGVRFATLAVFCQRACESTFAVELDRWRTEPADDQGVWSLVRAIPAPEFFFWIFARRFHEGVQLPQLEPPHPNAVATWREVRAARAAARFLWAGVPPWLAPDLERRAEASGWTTDEVHTFQDQQATRPPLWLRLNHPEELDVVLRELQQFGFSVDQEGDALAVRGEKGIFELPSFKRGHLEVQDLASQAIGLALAAEPGQFVWDCCAGAGGKSLQLAALMGGRGAVYATDWHAGRLQDLRRRAQRAGFNSIRAYPWDGGSLPDFGSTIARRGGFDRVLVDAPCSGSGTWRRNPDGRLRLRHADLADLTAVQRHLLTIAAGAVAPGGHLVYATCSWLCEENEAVTDALLAERADFSLRSQAVHGNPRADADTTYTAVLARADTEGQRP